MSRIGTLAGACLALGALPCGCSPARGSAPPPQVTVPRYTGLESRNAEAVDSDPGATTTLLAPGAEPRQPRRYDLAPMGGASWTGEYGLGLSFLRYETTYGAASRSGAGFVVPVSVTMRLAIPQFEAALGGRTATGPACTARLLIEPSGGTTVTEPSAVCDAVEANVHALPGTPLRPLVPLPEAPIGPGATWRVIPAPGEPAATHVLLDDRDGLLTVWGELEPSGDAPHPKSPPAPTVAWLLSQVVPSTLASPTTLAWNPPAKASADPMGPLPPAAAGNVAGTLLLRFDSAPAAPAEKRAIHDRRLEALKRALASPDPALRLAAVRASGITADWRLVEAVLGFTGGGAELGAAADQSLAWLTGRAARGPEDYTETVAPHLCGGDPARALGFLDSAVAAAAGTGELEARLIALRGDLHRSLGRLDGARRDYAAALAQSPSVPEVAYAVAWWRATAPEPRHRDGRRALALVDGARAPGSVLPLREQAKAAAHAELGDFATARQLEAGAIARLRATPELGAGAEARLAAATHREALYAAGNPCRTGRELAELTLCYRYLARADP